MYDTVNIGLYQSNKMDYIGQFLTDIKPTKRAVKNGLPEIEGYAENIRVVANNRFITLTGSLTKFLKGDNLFCIDVSDSKLAIEKISNWLHLCFENANLLRVDVSNSIKVKNNPIDYFVLLGNKGNYQPQPKYDNKILNGIYYGQKPKNDKYGNASYWTSFYNKGENLLRYELKVLRPKAVLKPILGDQQPQLKHLYQTDVNNLLVKRWNKNFKKIETIKEIPNEIDLVHPEINKELNDILLADINKTNAIGGFKHHTQYKRCKDGLNPCNICTIENPLMEELKNEINATYERYLV